MTYVEVLLLIQSRGETTLTQETRFLITDQHRYLRLLDDSENTWHQDMEAGAPERHYGRGGETWGWKKTEI